MITNSLLPDVVKNISKHGRLLFSLAAIVALSAMFVAAPKPTTKTNAAPFSACNTHGLLYQYPDGNNTTVFAIDMVTGQSDPPATPTPTPQISGRTINAVGYNVHDNFVYGWDNTADNLVRIHEDFTVEDLTITGFTTTTNIIIGDVDENGHYWFIDGNGSSNGQDYYAIDVNTSGTTVSIVDSGTISGIPASHTAGADWAYVPGGDGLYRVMHDTANNQGDLLVFDRSSGAFSSVGLIDQSQLPHTDLKEGAFYADADGFLYASDNDDGNIYRVNVQDATASFFSNGPASNANDGARCANAHIPIDFGDAPDVYGTLLDSNGPRHGVSGFNAETSTAPLMLGKKIDIETDGVPGADARGDDENHTGTPFVDDEDSVQHIIATPSTPTALSIPVTVTNNTSDDATLAGWIDLNSNDTFDVGERVTTQVPANSGTSVYELNFPETTFTDNTYARFRVFSDADQSDAAQSLTATGPATGGEVEDYLVQVGTYEVEKTSNPANGTTVDPGDTITYTLSINNTGLTDLVNLTIHDDLSDVLDDATLVGDPAVSPSSAGSAVVDHDELEFVFTGDVLAGQAVTVTYTVEVKPASQLGNNTIRNHVIAAHSNCHPVVENNQHASPADPACQTTHAVAGLADTGLIHIVLVTVTAAGFIAGSAIIRFGWRSVATAKAPRD